MGFLRGMPHSVVASREDIFPRIAVAGIRLWRGRTMTEIKVSTLSPGPGHSSEYGNVEESRPPKYRTLSSRFSVFTGILLLWVVMVTVAWDVRQHTFYGYKGIL